MTIYLDDDCAEVLLAVLLRKAGHDVQTSNEIGLAGAPDAVHLTRAIRAGRVLISKNHDDYVDLHDLLMAGKGHHPGILIVRKDNNPRRDMKAAHIARAVRNLVGTGVATADDVTILNHYR
jgi:predicted nuclease of predicted toxin-antitoxin system